MHNLNSANSHFFRCEILAQRIDRALVLRTAEFVGAGIS